MAGSGSRTDTDPKQGECVIDSALIFLQSNTLDNRWLNGGRDAGSVEAYTRDIYWAYESSNNYRWIIRREPGDGSTSLQGSAKRNRHGQLTGIDSAFVFSSYDELKADYEVCTSEADADEDIVGDDLTEAYKECLADHFNEPIGRSLELVFVFSASPGYICGIKEAVVDDGKPLPGYCCLDAPFQLDGEYWGHQVSLTECIATLAEG